MLEVGSGVGNMTRFLISRDRVVATDLDAKYLQILHHLFDEYPHVTIVPFDLDGGPPPGGAQSFDTVLCLNVLEHIEDDRPRAACHARPARARRPPGAAGAGAARLYGEIDRAIDHFRRYERDDLLDKLDAAGFTVEASRFFNLIGVIGWYVNSRILRRTTFPPVQLALYDRLVPLFRLESRLHLPFGMSLIVVAQKSPRAGATPPSVA